MAKLGRKPHPTALKILYGEKNKDRINLNEPKPKPILADSPPSWLPAVSKKKWKELVPKMERLGILTEIDGTSFALMLLHYGLAVEVAQELKKFKGAFKGGKFVQKDAFSGAKKNPLHQLLRDHSSAYKSYMVEFGLSPSSRSNLHSGKDDEVIDPMEALIN